MAVRISQQRSHREVVRAKQEAMRRRLERQQRIKERGYDPKPSKREAALWREAWKRILKRERL